MRRLFLAIILLFSLILLGQNVFAVESLVLFLPFDEGSGDVVKDISGNGNDGKVIGAKWVNGKIGKALEFDGKSKVEIPDSPSLSPDRDITVMAWVNIAKGASGEMAIISKGQWAANDLPYEFTVTAGSDIFWQFYDNEGRDSCSPATPPVGEWHHLVGTYDGAKFQCFIDGEMAEEFSYKGKLPKNTASVAIGKRSKAEECYFMGIIDEVAIFNKALTNAEIKSAMNGIKVAVVNSKDKLPSLWGSLKKY